MKKKTDRRPFDPSLVVWRLKKDAHPDLWNAIENRFKREGYTFDGNFMFDLDSLDDGFKHLLLKHLPTSFNHDIIIRDGAGKRHLFDLKMIAHHGTTNDYLRGMADEYSSLARRPSPPRKAQLLLTILASSKNAEAVIGDLNERFDRDCQELGEARAARLYWARTIRSLLPLLVRAIVRGAKWVMALELVRRFF